MAHCRFSPAHSHRSAKALWPCQLSQLQASRSLPLCASSVHLATTVTRVPCTALLSLPLHVSRHPPPLICLWKPYLVFCVFVPHGRKGFELTSFPFVVWVVLPAPDSKLLSQLLCDKEKLFGLVIKFKIVWLKNIWLKYWPFRARGIWLSDKAPCQR